MVEQRVAPVLRGQDPTRRGPLLADLAKVLASAPFTTAAVDTALLDLTGRALGVPVSALLGGAYRDRASKAQGLGATTAYGVQATRIRTAADRVVGVKTTAGTVAADALVVAAGVWTPYLTRTAGIDIPIMPVVMSELETEPVPPLFTATLRAFGFGPGSFPRSTAFLLPGAGVASST